MKPKTWSLKPEVSCLTAADRASSNCSKCSNSTKKLMPVSSLKLRPGKHLRRRTSPRKKIENVNQRLCRGLPTPRFRQRSRLASNFHSLPTSLSLTPHVGPHLAPHFSSHPINLASKVARSLSRATPFCDKPFAPAALKHAPFILNTFQENQKKVSSSHRHLQSKLH